MAPYAFLGALSHLQMEEAPSQDAIDEALRLYDLLTEADVHQIASSPTVEARIAEFDLEGLKEADCHRLREVMLYLKAQH